MTALEALSAALGVQVTGVRRTVVHVGRHQQHPNAWRLCMPSARYGRDPASPDGSWTWPFKTSTLRRPDELSRLAQVWGRPQDAPPFTSSDPRRILRLLHEAAEAADREMTA